MPVVYFSALNCDTNVLEELITEELECVPRQGETVSIGDVDDRASYRVVEVEWTFAGTLQEPVDYVDVTLLRL